MVRDRAANERVWRPRLFCGVCVCIIVRHFDRTTVRRIWSSLGWGAGDNEASSLGHLFPSDTIMHTRHSAARQIEQTSNPVWMVCLKQQNEEDRRSSLSSPRANKQSTGGSRTQDLVAHHKFVVIFDSVHTRTSSSSPPWYAIIECTSSRCNQFSFR